MSARFASPVLFDPHFSFDTPSASATGDLDVNIDPLTKMDEKKAGKRAVPFTVASVLPKCDYKEEWEPKERRTDAYSSAQSEWLFLRYLDCP